MQATIPQPRLFSKPNVWPLLVAAIVALQIAASLIFVGSPGVAECSQFVFLFIELLGSVICAWNAVHSRHSRIFWSLFAGTFLLDALAQLIWMYHLFVPGGQTVHLMRDTMPQVLAVVLALAALSVRPDLKPQGRRGYRRALDFMLILSVLVFLYTYAQFPNRNTRRELLVFAIVYTVENIILVIVLAVISLRASRTWKTIYWNLLGASLAYVAHRILLALASRTGGTPPILRSVRVLDFVALCWYVWAAVLGSRLRPELERDLQPEPPPSNTLLFVSRLVVLSIPVVGIWELYDPSEPAETHVFRLFVVLITTALLAVLAALKEFIERNYLFKGLSRATVQNLRLEKERLNLSGRLIAAQEVERTRIGRELHDDLNQRLGFLAFELAQLSGTTQEPETRDKTRHLWETANVISKEVHRISHELHPAVLEHLGLASAAKALISQFCRQNELNIELTGTIPEQLPPEISLCLFRVLQECLNNVAKHSQADRVQVSLTTTAEGLALKVSDNGVGFDAADQRSYSGLGFVSMQERLRLVGGALELQSEPFRGTSVIVRVPIQPAASGAAQSSGADHAGSLTGGQI